MLSITADFSQMLIPRGGMESINCNTVTVVGSKNLALKTKTLTRVTAKPKMLTHSKMLKRTVKMLTSVWPKPAGLVPSFLPSLQARNPSW